MDPALLSSISGVAVGVFVVSAAVVVYEVYLVMKHGQAKETKKDIKLPDFNKDVKTQPVVPTIAKAKVAVASAPISSLQENNKAFKILMLAFVFAILAVITIFMTGGFRGENADSGNPLGDNRQEIVNQASADEGTPTPFITFGASISGSPTPNDVMNNVATSSASPTLPINLTTTLTITPIATSSPTGLASASATLTLTPMASGSGELPDALPETGVLPITLFLSVGAIVIIGLSLLL